MPSYIVDVVVVVLLVGLAVTMLVKAIRIVPEYQRLVVFRLGRALGARGPGLVLLIPFVDRGVVVDLRERFFDVTPQTTITADNAQLAIDFLVYSKIVDALSSVLNVEKYEGASRGIAITTLRAVVGSMLLDDVLAKREQINDTLRGKLDEVTNRWGIKVTAVEIREISTTREIHEAMTRQMSAERTRRAMVTEAEGQRAATIRVAEGKKQATILEAEGAREAALLRAQGFASALDAIFAVAHTIDDKTMSLQYLDMLKSMGANPATKIVVPLELASLVRPFVEHIAGATGPREEIPLAESRH
ncbi:Putative stomatin/prohibitin-family membrane protease subunit YbbK [Labilithrix luteola]|uniref:Protein QmcA n=1 Tax=Labilithrix luteola TaxID=1391654 RepID=A0A0K1PWB1_9BACT|nr:SPFH domain-containing protein [Labilithrix luteola]AKU97429.1 Putative stomatin/prohibitin-family membrane protease subunit YbbK [Labilithrix luteola]